MSEISNNKDNENNNCSGKKIKDEDSAYTHTTKGVDISLQLPNQKNVDTSWYDI